MKIITCLNLSAGGPHVFFQLGALQSLKQVGAIDERNLTTLHGSSIGAVVCCLLAMQKTIEEIVVIFRKIAPTFSLTKHIDLKHFLSSYGLVNLENLFNEFIETVQIPMDLTFADLSKDLVVTGYAVKEQKTKYFSKKNTPNMPVLLAIRISCSVPLIFQSVYFQNDLYVDGATKDNWLPIVREEYIKHTIAINLTCNTTTSINSFVKFVSVLINGVLEDLTKKQDYKEYYLISTEPAWCMNIFGEISENFIEQALKSGSQQCHQQRQHMLSNSSDKSK
jgi:predicted acylesterase/phospholipase RssA